MKPKNLILLVTIIIVTVFSMKSFGQFEQKYTLQASGGMVKLTGGDEYGLGDYFNSGVSFDAGIQYNYSRSLSFVGLIKYVKLLEKSEPGIYEGGNLYSLGINICPKYRFFTTKKVNPYILGGVGLFFTSYTYPYQDEFGNMVTDKIKFPISFGYTLGAGADIALNDNFALFLQGGYSSTKLNDEGDKFPMNTMFFQVGVNISFLKSSSL